MHRIENLNNSLVPTIINYLKQGYTAEQIQSIINITAITIRNIVKRNCDNKTIQLMYNNGRIRCGQNTKKRLGSTRKQNIQNILQDISLGLTHEQIQNNHNFGKGYVRSLLKQFKLNNYRKLLTRNSLYFIKDETQRKHFKLKQYIEYYIDCGLRSVIIAQKLNISTTTLWSILKTKGTQNYIDKLNNNTWEFIKPIRTKTFNKLNATKISKSELVFRNIILKYIPNAEANYPIKSTKGFNWYIDVAWVDRKIAFEYDGLYWHKKEKDIQRDKDLLKLGWTTFRFPYLNMPPIEELEKDITTILFSLPYLISGQQLYCTNGHKVGP